MAGENKKDSCDNIKYNDSTKVEDCGTCFDFPLEKVNILPRKKLLVMNNGILLFRFHRSGREKISCSRPADLQYGKFLVFKRPFCEEFMKFCFERFEVGIWSSAKDRNIDAALGCAIGPSKEKLLFIWDQDRCTDSGFKSLEAASKPLFFKELKNVWENVKQGGPYSSSNTLLIDTKPYKALLNPPNTAIFPEAYDVDNEDDRALDPKGELCSFLEGLSKASDVQSYVKDHVIGQPLITSSHPDWKFYSRVKENIFKTRHNI